MCVKAKGKCIHQKFNKARELVLEMINEMSLLQETINDREITKRAIVKSRRQNGSVARATKRN
jgi:hypothetical protein